MAELISPFEGHIIALPFVKATVYPFSSRTPMERRFFLRLGTYISLQDEAPNLNLA